LRIKFVHQELHSQGKVLGGTPFAHLHAPKASLGLEEHKQVGRALALVLVVVALWVSRLPTGKGMRVSATIW
jgi:hypothetical protein